jgi:hypothetical protein
MTRRFELVARITDAHRAAIADLTRATALLPAQRRREKLLALGIAMGLERAVAICLAVERHQQGLTGQSALDAAHRIKAEARSWKEAAAEEAPVPTPQRRPLRIAGTINARSRARLAPGPPTACCCECVHRLCWRGTLEMRGNQPQRLRVIRLIARP